MPNVSFFDPSQVPQAAPPAFIGARPQAPQAVAAQPSVAPYAAQLAAALTNGINGYKKAYDASDAGKLDSVMKVLGGP